MPKKERKYNWKKPSNNPLGNPSIYSYLERKQEKEKKKDTLGELKQGYETILKKNIKRQYKAYKVTFKNHPDLYYIAFCNQRSKAMWQATKYFHESFHPFFTRYEDMSSELLNAKAIRVQELDKYGLKGFIPIPELMRVLELSMPCSVCKKHKFTYSDYINNKCYIIEGEGNLNPFTKGYLLCHDCYKKYIDR